MTIPHAAGRVKCGCDCQVGMESVRSECMFRTLVRYIASWDAWTWFGFVANFFFFLRFVAQWIATERAKHVVIPGVFWHLSIIGGVLILIYSVVRRDVVFIAASALSLVVYARNLWFHHRVACRAKEIRRT